MDSHPHAPKYSLIIPVLNDAGAVDQCLGHLREQVTAEVEVIVVEVNNTPWVEQFCYVLPNKKNQKTSKPATITSGATWPSAG